MEVTKDSKIVVTGGTGFLGSHIIRALKEKGYHNIVALKRTGSKLELLEGIEKEIEWKEGDVLDVESLNPFLTGADIVIHSAAKVSYNPKDKEQVFKINVEGTANVVNVCLETQPTKLLFVSSVAAIGRVKNGLLINEKSEWTDSEFNTNYAISKNMAEMEVWRGMVEGLNIAILCPSLIIGPSFWGDSSTKVITHVAKGSKMYPIGENGFVDVRDVAALVTKLMASNIKNERVIAVGEMSTYKNLFQIIAKALDKKAPSIRIGKSLGAVAWRVFKLKRILFGGDPPITRETVRITSGVFLYDNSKSREVLNFEYRSLEQTIEDTVKKFKESQLKNISYGYFDSIFE